eukprot:1557408-Prymnesium_polylepis.2
MKLSISAAGPPSPSSPASSTSSLPAASPLPASPRPVPAPHVPCGGAMRVPLRGPCRTVL